MTTGGLIVMAGALFVVGAGWLAALFTHHQVVEHKRRLALEAAKAERPASRA